MTATSKSRAATELASYLTRNLQLEMAEQYGVSRDVIRRAGKNWPDRDG
jgi:hypothetical protein